MSNTKKFAERELEILLKSSTDPDNRPLIEEFIPEILALVDKFGHSGQSGGSAPYTASAISRAIEKLCLQKPICSITGIDDEWNDVSDMCDGETMYQNRRCAALFKHGKKKQPYYLDAIVWQDSINKSNCWTGSALLPSGEKINSRQFIKAFPFEPKTFYVEVIRKEVAKDDFDTYVKNEKQLDEVFSYYQSPWKRNVLIEKVA